MTLKALETIGTELGLVFTKHHSRERRARLILDKYNELDLQAGPNNAPSPSDTPALADPKPEFERLIDSAAQTDPESPQRGGAGRGQGRGEGVTDDVARMRALSKVPNPLVQGAISRLFDTWAARTGCDAVRLTKEQAIAMGLAWTNALEWSRVTEKLSPGVMVMLMCGWTTVNVFLEKSELARAHAKRLVAEKKDATASLN